MIPLGILAATRPPAGGPVVQFLGAQSNDNSGMSYSFSVDIGDAAADRVILVVAGGRSSGSVNGVTVNGVTATQDVISAPPTGQIADTSIWRADVPTGSGVVTVNVSNNLSATRMSIAAYRVDGTVAVSGTPATATADAVTMSVTVPAGGFAIAGSTVYSAAATDCEWTSIAEDGTTVADGIIYTSVAHTTTAGSLGIVADWTVTSADPMSAAAAYSIT